MMLQSDSISRSIELFRELATTLISGSEIFACWQVDKLQESMTRNTQQLRTALSDASAAQKPAQWPETMQSAMRNAINMSRDYLITTTDCQMESMRMLQSLRTELEQIITKAMNEQLVNINVLASREKRSGKGVALAA